MNRSMIMDRLLHLNKAQALNPELLKQYEAETLQRCNKMVRFVTIFVIFAGNPAFLTISSIFREQPQTLEACFNTPALPAIRAGAR